MASESPRRIPGFDAEGEWLRCSLHSHTNNSDGFLGPSQLVRLYELGSSDVRIGGRRSGDVDGELLTRVRFTIPSERLIAYIRVQVEDGFGRYAWSNPIRLA